MAIETDLIGTITLTAGQLGFSVVGFSLQTGGVVPGGELFLPEKGLILLVGEVTGETTGKLTDLCPAAAAGTNQKVRHRFQPDGTRYSATSQNLMEKLTNGNIDALAGLAGEIEKIPMFIGPGAMELVDKGSLTNGVTFDAYVATMSDRAAFDAYAKGYKVLVANTGDGRAALYTKKSNTLADWSAPSYITGPVGPPPNVSVAATDTLAPGSAATVTNIGSPTAPTFKFAIPQGYQGFKGWSMKPAIIADGVDRQVIQVVDWIGGEGAKPPTGQYIGASGLVNDIADAINVKGNTGSQGEVGTPWQGDWNVGTSYLKGDLVTDNDVTETPSLWIALRANVGKKPRDNALDWDFFPATFGTSSDYGSITVSASGTRDYGSIA